MSDSRRSPTSFFVRIVLREVVKVVDLGKNNAK